ncbi:MAG: hypothetical protein ABSF51_10410 [Verrucomicrobiota bacterium]|jgi:hypothetical protein
MTKRKWALIVTALLLACVYVYHFTGWFKPKIIQISYTDRSLPSRTPSRSSFPTILFGFGGQRYQLSEIKIVPLAAWQTNQAVAPVWHLISTSRSAPVEFFRYGANLAGMKPAVPGARPEPLETNVTYRLLLRAGSYKGQCDFQLGGRPPAAPPNP